MNFEFKFWEKKSILIKILKCHLENGIFQDGEFGYQILAPQRAPPPAPPAAVGRLPCMALAQLPVHETAATGPQNGPKIPPNACD